MRLRTLRALLVVGALLFGWSTSAVSVASADPSPGASGFGPSVHIFNPRMD